MNKEDLVSFVEYIISIGGFIIIHKHYKDESYTTTHNINDIISAVDKSFLISIGHNSFFKEELAMLYLEEKDIYFIRQRYGGPVITFFTSVERIDKGNRILGYSNISYYASGYSKDGNYLIPVSKELKDFYQKLVKYVRKNSKMSFKHYKRKIWLGNNAYKDVVSGNVLLQDATQETLDIIRST